MVRAGASVVRGQPVITAGADSRDIGSIALACDWQEDTTKGLHLGPLRGSSFGKGIGPRRIAISKP